MNHCLPEVVYHIASIVLARLTWPYLEKVAVVH